MKPAVSFVSATVIVLSVVAAFFAWQRVFQMSSSESEDNYYSLSGIGIDLGPTSGAVAEAGEPAPDFVLLDLNDKPVMLSSLRGQTVLINFWASWCLPCRREMPDINAAFLERQGAGFTVLALNLQEGSRQARIFAEKYAVTFTVLLDSKGEVAKAYRLTGLPESWIVGSEGILREHKIGPFTRNELSFMLDNVMNKTLVKPD